MEPKLSPTQADSRSDGDVVAPPSKDWASAEEALSRLARVAADRRPEAAGSDFSAGPRMTEQSPDATLRPANMNIAPSPTGRPPAGRRAWRTIGRLLAMTCLGVVTTVAWQTYRSSAAQQMIATWVPKLGWSSPPRTDWPSDREIATEQTSPPVQASAPRPASVQATAVAPTASETAASTAPSAPSAELQQLGTLAHDLAAMRQRVEQLAAGQEQMARDIAKLQAAGQNIRRRISALPAPAVPARNPVPLARPAPQLSTTPLPPPQPGPQTSAAPLLPEPPSRPPMPVR